MAKEYLNRKISFQLKANSTTIQKELTIGNALASIQTKNYESVTLELRSYLLKGQQEKYKQGKQKLNAVTFCGTFIPSRNKSNIQSYTRILILDIDDLNSDELERTKNLLTQDPYMLAVWTSPSGRGLKALLPFNPLESINKTNVDKNHKHTFNYVREYLDNIYGIKLDKSGSDTSRLCYLSYDPNIFIVANCEELDISELPPEEAIDKIDQNTINEKIFISKKSDRDCLYNPLLRNSSWNRYTMGSIIRYLTNRNISITKSYDEWLRVGFAISNTFTFDIGLKYFSKLSFLDPTKYNKENCKQFLNECYHNRKREIGFSTIVFLAQSKGYKLIRKRKVSSEAVLP